MPQFPRIAAVCLAALSFAAPAWARLGVGPSSPIEPNKIPAVRDQDQVAAADNGTVTLFVWRDLRRGDADVFGARVRHDGTVLDPNGLELASGAGSQSEPAVSWDGTQWLVAWNDEGVIKASRVSTGGALLDPAPLELSGASASHPGLAWNGSRHIAVWAEGGQVHGATLDDAGNVVAAGAALSLGSSDDQPAIAAAGANALVVFKTSRANNEDVYAFRVTAAAGTLTRLDASDVALVSQTDPQESPAVASDGTKWLVAWEDARDRSTNSIDIRGTRVTAAGAAQDPTTIAIATQAGSDTKVALTYDGAKWLATWTSSANGQELRPVANNGNPGAVQNVSNTLPPAGDGAFGGPFVAFSEPSAEGADLVGRVVDTPLGSPFVLATQTPNQTTAAQAFGASHWMVAWLDDRFGPTERQVRIGLTDSARFEPPNPATIAFAARREGIDQDHPALVFDGTNFNLFWDEQRGSHRIVVGARFTPGGAPVDTFIVAGDAWNQYEPTADFAPPGDVLIAWTDTRVGPTERDIWIAQYTNGADAGGRKAMAQEVGEREEHPSLAVVQGGAIVAYETWKPGDDRGVEVSHIYLPIVSSSGIHDTVAKQAGHTYEHPRSSSNGEDGLVVFEETIFSDGPALHVPKAMRWNGDNAFSQSIWTTAPGSYTPANPVAASAGYDYLGLWSSRLTGDIDMRAAAISPNGDTVPSDTALTADPVIDTPSSAGHGLADRAGFTFMRAMNDTTWSGLQLYGGDARDTLRGEVLINEFLAHPARGNEFIELYNTSGRDFLLNGWTVRVNGQPNVIADCADIIFLGRKDGRTGFSAPPQVEGTPCTFLGQQEFFTDTTFATWGAPDPVEGHLPDRGAILQLFTPGGVLVDQVGYGYKGGAPVSGAIPAAIAPAAKFGRQTEAVGDSVDLSTARLPNGTNTGNDANDWNLTNSTTANTANTGTAAALGTTLFVGRAYWNPSTGQPTVELFNPSTRDQFDFSGWYISNNVSTEKIGVNTNAFSLMKPLDTRELRRGERGSFTFGMDQFSVLYLFGPDLTRYEQLGWSRPDQLAPDLCATRLGGTGGTHDGFDWFTCGGQDNINSGELRYTTCNISAPTTDVPPAGVSVLSFAGSFPNPSHGPAVLVFTVPGITGGQPVRARLSLYDVAGRRVATLVDGAFTPGTQRVPLQRVDEARRAIRAGTYYADLEVGGQRVRRTLVFLD